MLGYCFPCPVSGLCFLTSFCCDPAPAAPGSATHGSFATKGPHSAQQQQEQQQLITAERRLELLCCPCCKHCDVVYHNSGGIGTSGCWMEAHQLRKNLVPAFSHTPFLQRDTKVQSATASCDNHIVSTARPCWQKFHRIWWHCHGLQVTAAFLHLRVLLLTWY
jgi:hypothetical protein